MNKVLSLVALVVLLFTLFSCTEFVLNNPYDAHGINSPGQPDRALSFVDPQLEKAVREAINRPHGDIYPENVTGLYELDASEKGIKSLGGIEGLTSLTVLYLKRNEITDIGPLSSLHGLKVLSLAGNGIADIGPLSSHTRLITLWLYDNEISDLTALQNPNKLEHINLSGNLITDITPLLSNSSYQGGDEIILSGNPIWSATAPRHGQLQQLKDRGVKISRL